MPDVARCKVARRGVIAGFVLLVTAAVFVDVGIDVNVDVNVDDDADVKVAAAVAVAVPFSSPSFFWMHFSMFRRRIRKSSSWASSVVIRSPDASCSGGESGRALDLMLLVVWAMIVVEVVAALGLGLAFILMLESRAGAGAGKGLLAEFDDDSRGDLR